ncbi:MAG: hypothetical protein EHM42_09860, partial [Planctomycetaceae bacterium]
FAGLPDDLREELRVTQEELDRQRARQIASAPYAFEIPLFRAAESGSADCVRLLIEFGADVTVRDNARQTALFHAGSAEVARLLVEGGLSTEDRDEFDWTPLAANVGDPARLRALIAAGANVNAVHDRGFTVLMSAAAEMGRSVEALRVLVEAGADPHAVTDLGWNAFHAALDVNGEANDEQSVRSVLGYLRQLGVDIELRNRAGQTPLARALLEGTALEVRTLCELGADVNATGPTSACSAQGCEVAESPLVFAAISGDLGASQKLEALLDAGAKTTVRDPQGRTLLEAARERRSENADYEPSDFRDALLLEMRKCLARLRAHR